MTPHRPRTLRVAMCQMKAVPGEVEANTEATIVQLSRAAEAGAHLAVLPELVVTGWPAGRRDAESLAATFDSSPAVSSWVRLAHEAGLWVVGGLIERSASGTIHNSAAVIAPQGVVGRYRKLHLFGPEERSFDPGDCGLPVFPACLSGADVMLGVAVCYDLRFPEVLRILSAQGADLVAVPTGWVTGFDWTGHLEDGMTPQGRAAQVQANLDQLFVAIADRVGRDLLTRDGAVRATMDFLGASCLLDPLGNVAAGPADAHREETLIAEVDLALLEEARNRGTGIAPSRQRRTDVYGALLGYEPERWNASQPAMVRPPDTEIT